MYQPYFGQYYWQSYGTTWCGFKPIFVDSTYLQVDVSSSNESYKEDTIERADAIDIGGFLDTNDNGPLFLWWC